MELVKKRGKLYTHQGGGGSQLFSKGGWHFRFFSVSQGLANLPGTCSMLQPAEVIKDNISNVRQHLSMISTVRGGVSREHTNKEISESRGCRENIETMESRGLRKEAIW